MSSSDSTDSEASDSPAEAASSPRLSSWASLREALRSWRTGAVVLLSFSSGLPLGLVWYSIPDWMRSIGVDLRIVGLFTLAQAPWAFKVLWSPLMDRFVPPFWGRRRGWAAVTQVALTVLGLALAGLGDEPEAIWLVGALTLAIAIASASQDIAVDAYAVEVLRKEEQGAAVGARIALYRAGMLVAGGGAISLAGEYIGWAWTNVVLGLIYLPMLVITWKAPEPEDVVVAPRSLRDAVWLPFLGFLSRHRALEILAFVFFYKFADALAQSLTRPFLIDMGYDALHRGVALATVGMVATIVGAFLGGWVTTLIGLGRSLWIFGLLQIFSNVGYYLLAGMDTNLPAMYTATGFELLTSGMGTGAFSVLLLRMTQKRFSATQYALFSSLFALPRLMAGPISGFAANAIGWQNFFLSTFVMGIPGMILLSRFVPWSAREPEFTVKEPETRAPLGSLALSLRGVVGSVLAFALAVAVSALLAALKTVRADPGASFDLMLSARRLFAPQDIAELIQLVGIASFGIIGGLFTAAAFAARYTPNLGDEAEAPEA